MSDQVWLTLITGVITLLTIVLNGIYQNKKLNENTSITHETAEKVRETSYKQDVAAVQSGQIHTLVNSRLTEALLKITILEKELADLKGK